jgi:hypothetical protein
MTQGVIQTQGTELYFIDTLSSSAAAIVKLECPTGITGLGGAVDQIEVTCLDTLDDKEYRSGLGNPGTVSVPFNFIPSAASHQVLFDLKNASTITQWMIGFSDGSTDPTLDSNDAFVAPAARTCAEFTAYVSDVNIDVATNEIVRGTLTLQRSGSVDWTFA